MPRTDEHGNLEFHPVEMPDDYICQADPENPFMVLKENEIISTRKCVCGKGFILHVKFDPEYPMHRLCDDCIQKLPIDPNQGYPDAFLQTMIEAGEPMGGDE